MTTDGRRCRFPGPVREACLLQEIRPVRRPPPVRGPMSGRSTLTAAPAPSARPHRLPGRPWTREARAGTIQRPAAGSRWPCVRGRLRRRALAGPGPGQGSEVRLRFATGITPASTGCRRPCKQHCAHRRAAREICSASAQRHWPAAGEPGGLTAIGADSAPGAHRGSGRLAAARSATAAIAARMTMAGVMLGVIRFFITHFLSYGTAVAAVLPCRRHRPARHLRRCGQRRRAASA